MGRRLAGNAGFHYEIFRQHNLSGSHYIPAGEEPSLIDYRVRTLTRHAYLDCMMFVGDTPGISADKYGKAVR